MTIGLVVLALVVWAACGVVAYAALMADFLNRIGECWGPSRGLRIVVPLVGPIGLAAAAFATPGFRYGFRWRSRCACGGYGGMKLGSCR